MSGKMVQNIINGYRLKRGDQLSFLLNEELGELCEGANEIRKALCGDSVDLCSIINGRSGRCSEDCKFCAQSAHHATGAEEYPFLSEEEILTDYRLHKEKGVSRYSIVTSGRALSGRELEQALSTYRQMAEGGEALLCASHGLMPQEAFYQLREAGVTRYHANIETSRNNFGNICTTHTFDDKVEVIRRAKTAGLSVCSGGIIGMGESWEDRIDMAFDLLELEIRSIPINILKPIKGTPLGETKPLSEEEILRTIAIFRYINPEAAIRLAAGRNSLADSGRAVFLSGANAAITGDMLTTSGNCISEDIAMLTEMGFKLTE